MQDPCHLGPPTSTITTGQREAGEKPMNSSKNTPSIKTSGTGTYTSEGSHPCAEMAEWMPLDLTTEQKAWWWFSMGYSFMGGYELCSRGEDLPHRREAKQSDSSILD